MKTDQWKAILCAILLPAILGFGCAYLAAVVFGYYGWSLFLGVPFLVSFGSSFLYRWSVEATFNKSFGIAVISLLALGLMLILFALEGLICLFMALPLAMVVALPGTWIGFQLAQKSKSRASALVSLLAFLLLPALMGFEQRSDVVPETHVVVSSISIDAPIDVVWKHVVSFGRISAPPRGIFRMGVAYPLEARIEGSGVGAMRYCVFSTGAFVEPITEWIEPHTLAFDVIENPPVMKELSIYENLDTPHLHGTFESTRGQFSLRQDGLKTILEGTTWYRQKLYPDWYWHPISDEIVHRIHLRVLDHIKMEAETGADGL